jgi:hypothetical protein
MWNSRACDTGRAKAIAVAKILRALLIALQHDELFKEPYQWAYKLLKRRLWPAGSQPRIGLDLFKGEQSDALALLQASVAEAIALEASHETASEDRRWYHVANIVASGLRHHLPGEFWADVDRHEAFAAELRRRLRDRSYPLPDDPTERAQAVVLEGFRVLKAEGGIDWLETRINSLYKERGNKEP